MELSNYVIDTNEGLLNLTTKRVLPKDSDEATLRKHFFLKGQERDAIDHVVFSVDHHTNLSLSINMTWRCNLRCTHCFVIDKLVKKDKSKLNPQYLKDFVQRYTTRFPEVKVIMVHFVGGEVSLVSDECVDVVRHLKEIDGIQFYFSTTINGTIINDSLIELLHECDRFVISVDGNKAAHNDQRKSLDGFDPYDETVKNIKRLVEIGFKDKIDVQAALTDEHMHDREALIDFYKSMLLLGVPKGKIGVGGVVPVGQKKMDKVFENYFKTQMYVRPCCKFRCGKLFQIDCSNKVYADYFEDYGESYLGELTDSIDDIIGKHRTVIQEQMPVLNDEKCMTCPVIGVCWGRCCNFKQKKPSEVCDQEFLIKKIHTFNSEGALIDRIRLNGRAGHTVSIGDST